MAYANSPDRVTFLFIDYKGGAAFAKCVHLPHCVGLVTDLSPYLVRRASAASGGDPPARAPAQRETRQGSHRAGEVPAIRTARPVSSSSSTSSPHSWARSPNSSTVSSTWPSGDAASAPSHSGDAAAVGGDQGQPPRQHQSPVALRMADEDDSNDVPARPWRRTSIPRSRVEPRRRRGPAGSCSSSRPFPAPRHPPAAHPPIDVVVSASERHAPGRRLRAGVRRPRFRRTSTESSTRSAARAGSAAYRNPQSRGSPPRPVPQSEVPAAAHRQ